MSFPAAFFGATIFDIYLIHHTSSAPFKTSVSYPNILARLDALPKLPYNAISLTDSHQPHSSLNLHQHQHHDDRPMTEKLLM